MFPSNNNCIDQQPMFNRPFFMNDISPSSKMYPAPLPPIHDQYYSSSFSNTFNSDHHHHQNSSAADDQDFIAAFLQQQQHQDLLVGHQFSQIQQQNTTTTTTTNSISKQTGITTTDHHQTNLTHLNNMINMEMISNKNVDDDGGGGGISRRREPAAVSTLWKKKTSSSTSKKDRHSKIVTAQGPRDRRMRLSLEIASRFFTLQDMLGFDKASKTVEWLLTKSKGAIKELTGSIKGSSNNNTSTGGGSSTSECEVVSVLDHSTPNVVVDDDDDDYDDENKVQISNTISSNPKEKRVRVIRKPTFHHHPPLVAKDSRAKARARARERTIEKMRSRSTAPFPPHNINQLRANSSSYETGCCEESGSQSHDMSLEMVAADQQVEDHPPAAAAARSPSLECQGPPIGEEYSFVINRNSSPTTTTTTTTSPLFFDYNHEIKTSQGLNLNNNNNNNNNNNCNFPENWDIDSSSRAHSSYYSMENNMHLSTTDFQFVSKPWIT